MITKVTIIDDTFLQLPYNYNLYLRGDILDFLFGLATIFLSCIAIKISTQTAKVQNELQSFQMIAEEKRTYLTLISQQKNSKPQESDFEHVDPSKPAFENLCNAYDVFCGKYLAKDISRTRFLHDYSPEIIQWVEAFPHHYSKDSAYSNTVKAYNIIKKTELRRTQLKDFFSLSLPADHIEDLEERYQKALNSKTKCN